MKREVKQDSVDFKIFMAIWDFWKKNGTPEENEEYWDAVIDEGSKGVALNDEYKEAWDLSSQLFMAVVNVLEARRQSMKRYGDDKHGYEMLIKRGKERGKSNRQADK